MRVLVSDVIAAKGIEIMKNAGFEVDVRTGMPESELKACIGLYDALVVRSATKVTGEIIRAATRLMAIGRAGSGTDNIDKKTATQKGIAVINTPGANTVTTAEHTLAMMLSLARMIPQACASVKARRWEKKKFTGVELFGKTLGVIGLGAVGSEVAWRASALGMKVIAYDPAAAAKKNISTAVARVDLERIFSESDFITIHSSLTSQTRNLINVETILAMKPGVRIINCARGGIVDETALFDALVSGRIAGAASDVFETEPPGENPLLHLDNFICTPHLGASTVEAQENVSEAVALRITDYLISGNTGNVVNMPAPPSEHLETLLPYMNLAEQMGAVASQMCDSGPPEIVLECCRDIPGINSAPVALWALKGFLAPILQAPVTYVNALVRADEIGATFRIAENHCDDASRGKMAMRIRSAGREGRIYGLVGPGDTREITGIEGMYP